MNLASYSFLELPLALLFLTCKSQCALHRHAEQNPCYVRIKDVFIIMVCVDFRIFGQTASTSASTVSSWKVHCFLIPLLGTKNCPRVGNVHPEYGKKLLRPIVNYNSFHVYLHNPPFTANFVLLRKKPSHTNFQVLIISHDSGIIPHPGRSCRASSSECWWAHIYVSFRPSACVDACLLQVMALGANALLAIRRPGKIVYHNAHKVFALH